MLELAKLVNDKVEEYGITIFKHHPGDENQYVFFCQDMVIFVFPDNKSISIAFQATTKPDIAATNILILQEIPDIEIEIMESFIYCNDNKLICGEAAFQLVKDSIKAEGAKDYMMEEAYTHLLQNVNCHEC